MLELTVKTLDSQNHSFSCEDDITVRGFKEHIADTVNVPVESQRLIYCGRVLQDDKKLNDYGNVNGKVIHLVQRAPPQPESRNSSYSDVQRQINEQGGWMSLDGSGLRELGGSRLQYRGHLHRNAMYLGSMSVPPEVVEGLPAPQLSNTLSNSRLMAAKRMLTRANQLMNRMDDPSVPLHPSPTENTAPPPQASAPEEESEQNSNVNSNESSRRNRNILLQAASEAASVAAAFSAAGLINIRLSQDNSENGGNASGSVTVIDASRSEPTASAQPQESGAERPQPQSSQAGRSESGSAEPGRSGTERREQSRSDASTSNSDNQSTSRRSTPQVPRPSEMANVLGQLLSTQNRLTPYLERYRLLMETDPALTPGSGPEGVTENQRIVDGVSETLHFLSHACHTLSDIIVDMGQQPPRNLRCRPIVIQHSAILQAGIPIQVESHINLTGRNTGNNNNATDEGNEATRPSSPTSGTSDQSTSRPAVNIRTINSNANGQQNQPSLLGTLLNLPTNVELSMELSPQSTMDLSSPSQADGSENEQGQSNNNNNNSNAEGAGNFHWINPSMALIRDALESALNERHSQMDTSTGSATNTPTNIPFITIAGQQTMDLGTPNSGQSTQARSNIGTHPTTSTQTRSTARPHVLHPHTHPLNVGVGMGQSLDFDPFLPCNSHHIRRNPPVAVNTTSTSQSNQANQATSENSNRSQTAPRSTTSTRNTSPGSTLTLTRLDNERALASGIGLAMTFRELLQAPSGGDVHISLVGSGPNSSEIELSPDSDLPLSELLRSMNLRVNEFAGQNFLIDLWLFLLRNFTLGHLMELTLGGSTPLINLRRPLREFLEHSFPNLSRESLQERVVEEIVSNSRTYLDSSLVPETEIISNRRVNIPATFEAMLRKFCAEFLQLLLNNDLSNTTFALEAFALTKKLEEQTSAVFQHILQGGQIALETITSRFVTQLTEGINDPFFQHTLVDDLIARFRAYGSRTTQMTPEEINALLVYQDEPSAPPAETEDMESSPAAKSEAQPEPQEEEGAAAATVAEEVDQAQALPLQEPIQAKAELQEEETDTALEPMETEPLNEKPDDPMDLAFGQDIPETFPGAEYLPPEWVPIIARDTVRQRRQSELEKLQGGPIPFSDAYLSCMPSKRRKLIEQQKPQILTSPTPANTMPIPASVERLVREGIAHSQLEEAEGAASAVAATPAVRNAFGQAIKDCLHPGRLKTPDFPNSRRFPNASRLFTGDGDSKDKEAATTTKKSAASMSPSAASTTQTSK